MADHPIIFSGPEVRAILDGRKTHHCVVMKPPPRIMRRSRRACKLAERLSGGIINADQMYEHMPEIVATHPEHGGEIVSPFGVPGDRLWVRETWRVGAWDHDGGRIAVDYRADGYARAEWLDVESNDQFTRLWIQSSDDAREADAERDSGGEYRWSPGESPTRWRPSIYMPKWACRLWLENCGERVMRVQEIHNNEAKAEGVPSTYDLPVRYEMALSYRPRFRELWDSLYAKKGFGWDTNPWVRAITFKRVEECGRHS